MGRSEIIEKLDRELGKDIETECQVVYILSRIRKILEIDNLKFKYKFLNFYCNLALHPFIDRTNPIQTEMLKFKDDDKGTLNLGNLKEDLDNFLIDNSLNKEVIINQEKYHKFINLLIEVISDTPIIIKQEVLKIEFRKNNIPDYCEEIKVDFKIV